MARPIDKWRQDQKEMMKRHAAEIEAVSSGSKEQKIKALIEAHEEKLKASKSSEFYDLTVDLNRQISEVRADSTAMEDVKSRHQKELNEHLMRFQKLATSRIRTPGPRSTSLSPKRQSSSQSPKKQAKRPLPEVGDCTTSLEWDGVKVRWMLRVSQYPDAKRRRLDDASHTDRDAMTLKEIKKLRYSEVRKSALENGHWDTITEYPPFTGQFWVVFCAEHNMHFKDRPLMSASKHINGILHDCLDKNFPTALTVLGYYITDCNREQAELHNAEVRKQLEEGYQPANIAIRKIKSQPKKPGIVGISRAPNGEVARPRVIIDPKSRIITDPKPFRVYYCFFEKQYWACLILGWDKQVAGLPFRSLEETLLFNKKAKPPQCHLRDSKRILGWAEGYQDGGPYVHLREFPIMYFDGQKHVGWAPAVELSKVDLTAAPKGWEYPEASYNEARQWIATTAGYRSWEEYQASGVDVRKPKPTAKRAQKTTRPGLDEYESEFDEELDNTRERGGDNSADEDYRDEGGVNRGRPPKYVTHYEDDEWTLKYNLRQDSATAAKNSSKDTRSSSISTNKSSQVSGTPILPPSARRPTSDVQCHRPSVPGHSTINVSLNGSQDRKSEPRLGPQTGTTVSDSIPLTSPMARAAAREAVSASRGPEPGCIGTERRLPDLPALVTTNFSLPGTRDVKSEPPKGPDDSSSASPMGSTAGQQTMSANPTSQATQRRTAASLRGPTTMSAGAMTATPAPSIRTSPVSAAPTPTLTSASPTVSTPRLSRVATGPRTYEITRYQDDTRSWERRDRLEACVRLYTGDDERVVSSSDDRISIHIDPQQCMKPQLQTIEGREGMSLITLPQVSGRTIGMVFDRSSGSNLQVGKIQARNFVRWLQAQNAKLR